MIFNFLGVIGIQATGKGLLFESQESRAEYSNNHFELESPTPDFLKLSVGDKRVFDAYHDNEVRILTANSQWSSAHSVLGGNQSYVFFNEDADQDLYVARRWDGEVMFQIPYFSAERYFAPELIALGNEDIWTIVDLTGRKINEITCSGLSGRSGQARFTDRLFLFRTVSEPSYEIYDVEKCEMVSSVSVVDCVFAMLATPEGGTWLVDAEGVKYFDHYGSPHTELRTIYRFSTPLDVDQNDVLIWHDPSRIYVACSLARDSQLVVAISLDGSRLVEELRWTQTWSITWRGGYLNGYNYLTLGRSDLLADNAVMLWTPDLPLTEELVHVDLSPSVEVSEVPSAIKAKHSFHIRVENTSSNRAVRSAAHEIGRLLGESCSGAYNYALEVRDRKFDGQFHIEITTPFAPNDFERGYLATYIQFFRNSGGLSPAGSKAPLAEPIVTWKTSAS